MVRQTSETVFLDRKLKPVYAGKLAARSRRTKRESTWQEDASGPPSSRFLSDRAILIDKPDRPHHGATALSLGDLAGHWFARHTSLAQHPRAVRWVVMVASLPMGEGETVGISFPLHELCDEDSIDWERWHELRDIREERALTRDEETEYEWFARIVSRLDAEEETIAARAVEALVKKHERVIASLERLTEAVKAAAERA